MNDLKHYLSLMALLSLAIGSFWLFNYHRPTQIAIILLTGILYVIWGYVHHRIKKDLSRTIIAEYVLVATMACLMLIALLVRA